MPGKNKIGVSFDLGIVPTRPATECLDMAKLAERLGYGGVWVADSHSVMRDAYEILAITASQTSTLKLATGVTHTVTRHPAVLANSCATLQELSGGRAVCGIGVGESAVRNLGLRPEKLAVFEEKIRVIRGLMRGETVRYDGKPIKMSWSNFDVPIFVACSGPRCLQLGGKIADGVLFQVGADPQFVQYARDNISKGAEEAGRSLEDIKLYMRIATAVSEDVEAARKEIRGYASVAANTVFRTIPREYFDDQLHDDLARLMSHYDYAEHASNTSLHNRFLTDRILDAIGVVGTPEAAAERFRGFVDMGVEGFVWPATMANPYPYIETFAEKVIPNVSGSHLSAQTRGKK